MNPHLNTLMARTDEIMAGSVKPNGNYHGPVHVGVDLGTASIVLVVLDEHKQPLAGSY